MKFLKYNSIGSALIFFLAVSVSASGATQKKSSSSSQVVDSGTFAVYVNGKRVAQEKFEITQSPELSVAKAELRMEEAKNPQIAELRLLPNGDLQRYTWSEKDQGEAIVEPKDEFLVEKVSLVSAKSAEQPFLMPLSTMVLDDYFFSQRQILLWRYLASQCGSKPGPDCKLSPTSFGVIVPRAQASAQVSVEYAGRQKVNIKGTDRDLARFEMKMEGNDWTLWVDEVHKIQKISIAAAQAEVYRE